MKIRNHRNLGVVLLTTLMMASLAMGCDKKKDKPPTETSTAEAWRKQSLALSVKGFSLVGGQAKPAEWCGSGVFVAKGIVVTNAHVAARALEIQGRDDNNRPHVFDKILAIDMANDLALIKADYVQDDVDVAKLMPKPADIKTLRQTNLLAIGNTGCLGLSVYEGRVTNVVEEGALSRVLHDAQIAGGSSGGPIFKKESQEIVGINHATSSRINASLAIPSWTVNSMLSARGKATGLPLKGAFAITGNTGLMNEVKRDICLPPGKAINVPAAYSNGIDFAVAVVPKDPNMPLIYGMGALQGQAVQYFDKGLVNGQILRVFTTPVAAQYVLTLGAPATAPGPTCVSFIIGQIDWGKQINAAP